MALKKFNRYAALLHLSGGQDSTFVMWDWLHNNPDKRLLVHHVYMRHDGEDRLEQEGRAVRRITQWFRDNGMNNFDLLDSSFDYGNLPMISVKDIQVISFFTGIILRTHRFSHIKELLISWHKGEVSNTENMRGYRVRAMLEALNVPDIEFTFPIADMTRRDMAEAMPEDLLKLVWFCRKPVSLTPCGFCHTCKEVIEAGIDLKIFNN